MKARLSNIIALFAIITIGIIACNNGDNGNNNTTEHVHEWDVWKVTTPATCTTAGEQTRTCKLDATHTETQVIAALGHDWGEWEVTTPPTTTAEGVETRTCKRDETHKETRAIAKLPEQPKDQTATITGLLDNNASATVKGNLTDTQWNDVADKIKTALNARFADRSDVVKDAWRRVLSNGVTIIVEASPDGYTNWKTIVNDKTIYLNLATTNADNLGTMLGNALTSISNGADTIDGIQQLPHDQTATITLIENHTATVQGYFTDAEWGSNATGIAGKIEAASREAVDGIPDSLPDVVKNGIKDQYRKCEFIIVEKDPAYVNWKTNGDGKTIFLNFNVLDSADLWNLINSATASMKLNGSSIDGVPQQ
jgi:hypothetical protein